MQPAGGINWFLDIIIGGMGKKLNVKSMLLIFLSIFLLISLRLGVIVVVDEKDFIAFGKEYLLGQEKL